VAFDRTAEGADGRPADFGAQFKFHEVFQKEIALINQRRARYSRGEIKLQIEAPEDTSGEPVWAPLEDAKVVGLALSGGGIRSSAFCLGVLQALHATRVLDRVDYLSTVSGGGYVGCSLTASLEWTGRTGNAPEFPFTSRLMEDEPPALQHIRDHSNYLFPRGASDLLHNASIYARGLAVNAVLVMPFILSASALTLVAYAAANAKIVTWPDFLNPFRLMHFVVTVDLALFLIAVGIAWGMFQSTRARQHEPEIPGRLTRWVGTLVIVLFASAFCEAQPFLLDALAQTSPKSFIQSVLGKVTQISAVLAPVGAVIAFLANKIGEFIKSATESPKVRVQIAGLVAKIAIYFSGLIVPLLLWIVYLNITLWGLGAKGLWYFVPALYCVAAFLCFILTLFMRPNANSLHPLYRDHLGEAFIFKPQTRSANRDLDRWRPLLSDITSQYGPYHLINTALNVQHSKTANRRGRNADFFVFTPLFIGSKSTAYVATRDVENVAVGLDLPSAMAVSGAAVSSNMGAQSIKPLTATLALLNIRLGYWMRNPMWLAKAKPLRPQARFRAASEFLRKRNLFANYYFLAELFGLLSDQFKSVYLTDGGHIENLGIYELLRRRCRVIIAVDAEADRQMAFGSFNTLERYALIDLGVRIDLPWQPITNESLNTGKEIDEKGDAEKHHGPHCAMGEIRYPSGRKGVLIYIKASLTGDENDYIFDYKKRHGDFPHETTLDQMFTEEQFEAYRALGFHAAFGLFDRSDSFAHLDPVTNVDVRKQIADLDQLFPRLPSRTGDPPRQKQAFTEWLPRVRRQPRRRADHSEGA
jgi:Patatin-like phospholipase